ncbi:hypothetical protein B0J13DRAFT_603151 [Dactylonectria estremocensis]|uniref:Uncharacterized protein n=1 Tax=Dactylonectria estremocensis TaxID=1079267 RepID=A0A9P9JEN3_9HYPO|nr:hypothetical protein B0J13DRAFT_603151 [Dactylonectria estremocensis]
MSSFTNSTSGASKPISGVDATEKGIYSFINSSDETLTNKHDYSGYPNIDEQLDKKLVGVIKQLRSTRSKMSVLTYPISTSELSDMVFEAREIYRKMHFEVRRHFESKEEGIRLHRDREVTALGKKQGLLKYLTKNMLVGCEKARLARNTHKHDKRLQLLEDAMNKVDMHRIIVVLAGSRPMSY